MTAEHDEGSPQTGRPPASTSPFQASLARAIYTLYESYARGDRATMASLRRAAGKSPEKDPLAWSYALDALLPDFPYPGRGDEPSSSEVAAFTALTLYALHQRSLDKSMHQPNKSLGAAVAELTLASGSKSVKNRLDALMMARTRSATHYHLRSLVNLLHAHEITLDYVQLGSDLWKLDSPEKKQGVILRWGRDYASTLWKKSSVPTPANA